MLRPENPCRLHRSRDLAAGALIAVLGLCAFILPVFVMPMRAYPDSLFPLLRAGIEGFNGATALLLTILGMIAALVRRTASVWRCGIEAMLLVPPVSYIDAFLRPYPSSQWPVELMAYPFEALFVVGGTAFVRLWLPRRVPTN